MVSKDDEPEESESGKRYRQWGAIVFSRCRRLLGSDPAASVAAQVVFRRIDAHLATAPRAAIELIHRAATDYCLHEWNKPRLGEDGGDPPGHLARIALDAALSDAATPDELAHLATCDACRKDQDVLAADRARFGVVLGRTLPIIERDAPAPRIARWVLWFGPIWVAAALLIMYVGVRMPRAHDPWMRVDGTTVTLSPNGNQHAVVATVDVGGAIVIQYNDDVTGRAKVTLPPLALGDARPVRIFAVLSHDVYPMPTIMRALDRVAQRGADGVRETMMLNLPGTAQTSWLIK